jgi:hypothetical protein
MDKKEASLIINKYLGKQILNPNNNGNVKFSNKSNKKNVYWINIHIDSRLSNEFHIILNDEEKGEFTHLVIPQNELKTNLFKTRLDKTNGLDKIDIELSYDNHNYLEDIKSGGTHYNFNKYISKVFNYFQ